MRGYLLVVLVILLFPLSILLGYFSYGRYLALTQEETDSTAQINAPVSSGKVRAEGETTVLSADNTRTKPRNPVDAILEFGQEITPGQAFTEAIFYDVKVVGVSTINNSKYLEIEKNGSTVTLPLPGLLGVKVEAEDINDDVLLKNLEDIVKTGDTAEVRVRFVGNNLTLKNEEIIKYFEKRYQGSEYFDILMEAGSSWGTNPLSEEDFLQRLTKSESEFKPNELQVMYIVVD